MHMTTFSRNIECRARVEWTEKQVRVWLYNGRMYDMGKHNLEAAKLVARNLGLPFVAITPLPREASCPVRA